MSQLRDLAEPFPDHLIKKNPSGRGQYVKHSFVNERLIAVVGPYRWECVEILRGDVPAIVPNPKGSSERAKKGAPAITNAVVGYVGRLTVEIDGRIAVAEEAGDCEEPHNWDHDGARLKDATSDAFKRCAMRLGLGLHLWSQNEYFLYDFLGGDPPAAESAGSGGGQVPSSAPPEPAALSSTVQEFVDRARGLNLTSAEKVQFRALLTAQKLPTDPSAMTDEQAHAGLALLNDTFPEDR